VRNQTRRHPNSVSATELSKLGQCEVLVIIASPDEVTAEMRQSSARGEVEHDRFHRRAVLNAGNNILARQL
jgi:hypothetical protein